LNYSEAKKKITNNIENQAMKKTIKIDLTNSNSSGKIVSISPKKKQNQLHIKRERNILKLPFINTTFFDESVNIKSNNFPNTTKIASKHKAFQIIQLKLNKSKDHDEFYSNPFKLFQNNITIFSNVSKTED